MKVNKELKQALSECLFVDIETMYNLAKAWRAGYNLNINPGDIVHERKIVCISWKWGNSKKVYRADWGKKNCDKALLKKFFKDLEKAKMVIAHNGDRFDIKWIKTRALFHGLKPITNIHSIDTLKLARSNFNFNSNKLDYIVKYLDLGGKVATGGMKLWDDVFNGCPKALEKMGKYCDNDVIILEKLFLKILPYVDKLPAHMGILGGGTRESCQNCGGNPEGNGTRASRTGRKQRWRCTSCGHNWTDTRVLKTK